MNTPGKEGSHSQHHRSLFTLGNGESVGWREGKRRRDGRNGEEDEQEIEGRKVNGRLFSHEVLFPVSAGQLPLLLPPPPR